MGALFIVENVILTTSSSGAYSEGVTVTDGALTVSTYADFQEALGDTSVNTINLGGNFEAPGKINIERDITINGGGYTDEFQKDEK